MCFFHIIIALSIVCYYSICQQYEFNNFMVDTI
jgi:hypothetical protein